MKYTTEQLILAAHVRELAKAIRQQHRDAAFTAQNAEPREVARPSIAFIDEFNRANDLIKYVPEALEELEGIMAAMNESRPTQA